MADDPQKYNLTHSHQVQIGVLMAAHYSSTRASIDDWLRRRDQYVMLYVTGSVAIIGTYLSRSDSILILYMIPPLTLAALLAYLSADIHIAFLSKWLKVEYTSLLERYVSTYGVASLAPWHWDNSATLSEFYVSGAGRLRYVFLGFTFFLTTNAAPILVFFLNRNPESLLLYISLVTTGLVFFFLFFFYRKRKNMAALPS
jgi:hypothetical protein